MGQSSNVILSRYPSLIFSPPLESIITIAQPACLSRKPCLRWQATLGREDYDKLCSGEIEVQVWSNCTGERWSATPFRQRAALNPSIGDVEGRFDLALFEGDAEIANNQVTLEASISIPPSVRHTVEFTYRVVDASGRTEWLGTNDTNGKIVVSGVEEDDCLKEEDWINEGDGMAFLWPSVVREPMVIARLPSDTKWSGWAFKRDDARSCEITHFVGITSEFVMGTVVTLALIPQAHRDAFIVYSPVLFTVQHGTLSLENNSVLLHPGTEGPTKLNAYSLTSTWKDHIPNEPALLDIQTSDFLAVSRKSHIDVGHLHFLPVTGARSIITLSSSDITSLVPSNSVFLFDPSLCAIKFLAALSLCKHLRIAVGPVSGGEMLIVPAYSLSASMSMAFLHGQGSITELKASCLSETSSSSQEVTPESSVLSVESPDSSPAAAIQVRPKGHSSTLPALLSLVVYMFQYCWVFLLSTVFPRPSSERIEFAVTSSQDADMSPRLAFEVTGKSSLLVNGEDAPKLRILVGGKLLQTTTREIGGGYWLIEDMSQVNTDRDQRRIEILLQE